MTEDTIRVEGGEHGFTDADITAAERIAQNTVDELTVNNIPVDDYEVFIDEGELWITIWLGEREDVDALFRVEEARETLQRVIREDNSLPSVVSVSYETSAVENRVQVWW